MISSREKNNRQGCMHFETCCRGMDKCSTLHCLLVVLRLLHHPVPIVLYPFLLSVSLSFPLLGSTGHRIDILKRAPFVSISLDSLTSFVVFGRQKKSARDKWCSEHGLLKRMYVSSVFSALLVSVALYGRTKDMGL